MIIKKSPFALYCVLFLMFVQTSCAQTQEALSSQEKEKIKREKNMQNPQWRKDNYIVNRDSAFANPYYALQKLKGGNKRFEEGTSIHPRQDPALIQSLSEGQAPFAIIVGCSDSRVSSEALFDQGFGDLFVARTAGQVMAQASYATIEYAYLNLGTKLIVVLGHTSCGAVSAAVKIPADPPGHIVTLINAIKPAALAVKNMEGDEINNAVRQNVINQVNDLRELESVLSDAYSKGNLLIIGAVYSLDTGKVEILDETMENFPPTNFGTEDITGL
ncbi:carbonic anhydrase [Salegentibacter sp. JZCK2]|uniref:carbonic anhydrase n=1 Tax=Salegentibacter tibetensis TaxID=2873600 RepID=UPI001CCEE17B|nr:carbonic anhydrase [Salegentibacter tibetensis]MBZ9730702.1 carbonic anhydrase [Salegentibacter tibetensis]